MANESLPVGLTVIAATACCSAVVLLRDAIRIEEKEKRSQIKYKQTNSNEQQIL